MDYREDLESGENLKQEIAHSSGIVKEKEEDYNELEEVVDRQNEAFSNPNMAKTFAAFAKIENRKTYDIVVEKVGVTVFPKKSCGKAERIQILQNVSARFAPKTMTAVMGSSGSGKTTLLNMLMGRSGGETQGKIYVNGKEDQKVLEEEGSYVLQHDLMLENLSVEETLTYSSDLRLPKSYDASKKQQIVNEVIDTLNLTNCRTTAIGGQMKKGISGGQKKRVAIGQELLTDPGFILLDEPTSGLDSATSINLIRSLRDFSRQGRTIVATIHQPSAEIFFLFDQLVLLAGGRQVYYGPTKDVVEYFGNLGYKCPQYQNPADYTLNLITSGYKLYKDKKWVESSKITKELTDYYNENEGKGKEIKMLEASKKVDRSQQREKESPPSELTRFFVLTKRNFVDSMRDPSLTVAKFVQSIFFGIIIGCVYLNLDNTQVAGDNRLGLLFFIVVNQIMSNLIGNLYLFPQQRSLFLREHSSGSYGVLSYYFAKIVAQIPFEVIFPFIFTIVAYFMTGLQKNATKFIICTICVIVLTHVAGAIAVGITAGVGSFDVALIFAPVVFIPLMLLGGFFADADSIPDFLEWVKWVSPFKHGFDVLAVNEFKGLVLTCLPNELVGGICARTRGEQILATVTDSGASIWRGFLILGAIAVGSHLLAIIFLHLSSKKPQA